MPYSSISNASSDKKNSVFFIIYGYITNSQSDQPTDELRAQLVEHCISITQVMGSNPVQA